MSKFAGQNDCFQNIAEVWKTFVKGDQPNPGDVLNRCSHLADAEYSKYLTKRSCALGNTYNQDIE